ncbi:MAG TPA: hypothetical protein VGY66_33845 [Gemmataceae bacterium]|jgi:hypothetical protein|nr:hypothetical protein [Gemmataceae bacterium]
MAAKAEQIGVKKAAMDFLGMFVLAVLAGAFIALGSRFRHDGFGREWIAALRRSDLADCEPKRSRATFHFRAPLCGDAH